MLCANLKSYVNVFHYLVHRHSNGQKHIFNWYANIRPCSLNINCLGLNRHLSSSTAD